MTECNIICLFAMTHDKNSFPTRISLGVFVTWLQINYMNYVKL